MLTQVSGQVAADPTTLPDLIGSVLAPNHTCTQYGARLISSRHQHLGSQHLAVTQGSGPHTQVWHAPRLRRGPRRPSSQHSTNSTNMRRGTCLLELQHQKANLSLHLPNQPNEWPLSLGAPTPKDSSVEMKTSGSRRASNQQHTTVQSISAHDCPVDISTRLSSRYQHGRTKAKIVAVASQWASQ